MKKAVFVLSCMAVLCLHSVIAKANYAAGGELIYEWISGSTYRFYLKLYRDCPVEEPNTVPLCFSNSCNATSFTSTMVKLGNPQSPWKYPCTQMVTKCDDPSAVLPGYQEFLYYADVTLPSQCNSWKAFTYLQTRKASINIANASSTNMYLEASFNNSGSFQGNSSPYYTNKPFLNLCYNSGLTFNNGAVDPNGDSLVTEVIQPLTSTASCSATASAASFVSASPALSVPANPFQTNNSFAINAQTGMMSFYTTSQTGVSSLAVRTKEYRNGVLVGSVMREMPVNVYNCTVPTTYLALTSGGNPVGGVVQACNGQFLTFNIIGTSTNPNAVILVTDNHSTGAPGSTMTYQNQGTDSVTGTFNWTVPANASGYYNLTVNYIDSTCGSPGFVYHFLSGVVIYVWNKVGAGPDTAICAGEPIELKTPQHVPGASNPQIKWAVVSGDVNSLNCTHCLTAMATPGISSSYEVMISGLPPGCPVKKDTVYVDVIPYTKPNVNIAASATNIWPGLNVTFTATPSNCKNAAYQWYVNGVYIPGATDSVFNTTSLNGNDIVNCRLTCSDTCIIEATSNAIGMYVATGIENVSGAAMTLYPNPNNGSFELNPPGAATAVDVTIVNVLGQSVWQEQGIKFTTGMPVTVDAGALPKGYYILKARYADKTETLRFVIDR